MSRYKTSDNQGRLVMYGFDKAYSGYFVTVWRDETDKEDPIIEEDHWTGLTGAKLVQLLEDELKVYLPEAHRKQALADLPIEDEDEVPFN